MSANEEIRTQLLDMGIDGDKAREAAVRYNTIEAALNWVFGEGESWTPSAAATDELPSYSDFATWDNGPAVGSFPGMAGPGPALGSNNPFNNTGYAAPPPPPPRRKIQEDEEDELRRALEISKAADAAEREKRKERERSVRASAPPPSPGRIGDDTPAEVTFGPSNKSDPDNQLAVTLAKASDNKEEEDFQRAIQESMMTASFHSVASEQTELPSPQPRAPGAPVVFLTSQQPTFAAHVLQALAAVPQLRDVFANIKLEREDPAPLVALHSAFLLQHDTNNYVLVDDHVKALHHEWEVHSTTLPPHMSILEKWIPNLHHQLVNAASLREELVLLDDTLTDFFACPEQLLSTRLHSVPMMLQHFVQFERTFSSPRTLHDSMATTIWTPENPGESIEQLADVVFVSLRRMPGVAAGKWELDDEVVLDRYLTPNAAWSAQIRGKQAVVQGELRRLKEQVERLTAFKDNNVPNAIQTLITHLNTKPISTVEGADAPDPAVLTERQDLRDKLERIAELMKAKVAKLQEAIAQHEQEASGVLFETDDPTKNQHKYLLRAILWHDGFLTPGKHLYAYVRGEDSWWRVQEESAFKVSWDEIQADTTGQFTDGGPYLLVYSRDGPRPPSGADAEREVNRASRGSDLMDIEMDDATTIGASTAGSVTDGGEDGQFVHILHHPATAPTTPMDARTTVPAPLSSTANPPAPAPAAPAPAAPASRSRPPSPVKGSVKGPRPLPKRSGSHAESVGSHAGDASLGGHAISTSPEKMTAPLIDLTGSTDSSRRGSTASIVSVRPASRASRKESYKKDVDDDLLM